MKASKKALVIGGNSSILQTFVDALRAKGYEIHATSRGSRPQGQVVSKHLNLDVRIQSSLENFIRQIQSEKYDLILSAIGMTSGVPIERETLSHIDEVLRVNLSANIWMLPRLIETLTTDGVIGFVGSSAAEGTSFDISYSAGKAGLRSAVTSYSSTRNLGEKRIYVFEPSLVEESTMYSEMNEANIHKHREKWNGQLLNFSDITTVLMKVYMDPKQEEIIQKIRPKVSN